MRQLSYYVLSLSWAVMANAFAISEATKRRDAGHLAQPDPTPMIGLSELRHLELGKRQETSTDITTFTLVVSPDSTCGYVSGSAGTGIVCFNDEKCSWEIGDLRAIFCGTTVYLGCYDREDAVNTRLCDEICQDAPLNLLCTKTSEPYCRTYSYESDIVGYRCASASLKEAQNVSFAYDGQKGRTFTTTYYSTAIASTTTTDPIEPTGEPSNKPNVGAIVGGIIGGLVAISLLVLGIIWIIRHKKKPDNTPPHQQKQQQQPTEVSRLEIHEAPGDTPLHEAPGDTPLHEAPGDTPLHEVPADTVPR